MQHSTAYLIRYCGCAVLFLSAPLVARSQNIEWVQPLAPGSFAQSRGVSADGLGNVYVSGSGAVGGDGSGGAFLAKFDSDGNRLWARQSDGGGFVSVSADGSEYIYIVGSAGGDAFVTKFDDLGNQIWRRAFGSSTHDSGYGVWADRRGNLYVGGETSGDVGAPNAGGNDVFLTKFNENGDQQWSRQIGGLLGEVNRGISGDSDGNVYVLGHTQNDLGAPNAGGMDVFVRKFDGDGNVLWTRQIGTSGADFTYGISAEAPNAVYFTGDTSGSLGASNLGSSDAFIGKFDSDGNLAWVRQFGREEFDQGLGVTSDADGNAYVSGGLQGVASLPRAIFVSKFDSEGNQHWMRQLASTGFAIANSVDGQGNVFVAGWSSRSINGIDVNGPYLLKVDDTLLGDYNGDGTVNAADYTVWRNGLATQEYMNIAYADWRNNYGTSEVNSSAVVVPEPLSLVWMIGMLIVLRRRRGSDL